MVAIVATMINEDTLQGILAAMADVEVANLESLARATGLTEDEIAEYVQVALQRGWIETRDESAFN